MNYVTNKYPNITSSLQTNTFFYYLSANSPIMARSLFNFRDKVLMCSSIKISCPTMNIQCPRSTANEYISSDAVFITLCAIQLDIYVAIHSIKQFHFEYIVAGTSK